jgi:hypothetical protein
MTGRSGCNIVDATRGLQPFGTGWIAGEKRNLPKRAWTGVSNGVRRIGGNDYHAALSIHFRGPVTERAFGGSTETNENFLYSVLVPWNDGSGNEHIVMHRTTFSPEIAISQRAKSSLRRIRQSAKSESVYWHDSSPQLFQ